MKCSATVQFAFDFNTGTVMRRCNAKTSGDPMSGSNGSERDSRESCDFEGAEASSSIPLSEIISALSYALDLTEGQPMGHSVRACMIGMRLAEQIGMSANEQADLYYALLLKDAGCSSNA